MDRKHVKRTDSQRFTGSSSKTGTLRNLDHMAKILRNEPLTSLDYESSIIDTFVNERPETFKFL